MGHLLPSVKLLKISFALLTFQTHSTHIQTPLPPQSSPPYSTIAQQDNKSDDLGQTCTLGPNTASQSSGQ
jgi:hypothetical protein